MSKPSRQACTACLRSFMVFRSEHRCELCGESVCRRCLAVGANHKFPRWGRKRRASVSKVCKLCDQSSLLPIREREQLVVAEPFNTWHCSRPEYTPSQRTGRAATPFIRGHAFSVPPANRDLHGRRDFSRAEILPADKKMFCAIQETPIPAERGSFNQTEVEDCKILTVDTDDMKKASVDSAPLFLFEINSSICEQRKILQWLQRATENRRQHAKSA